MTVKKSTGNAVVDMIEVERATIEVVLVGESPIILNAMSAKARQEILLPKREKSKTEKETQLKHEPLREFRDALTFIRDVSAPTLLGFPSSGVKGAMATATTDSGGTSKAQLGRQLYVEGELSALYGVPKLFMAVTRNSGLNKAPDVRTRGLMEQWALPVRVTFTRPILNDTLVLKLLTFAGLMGGLGDWRPGKGGQYGRFRVVSMDDPEAQRIMREGGRAAQVKAINDPVPHDDETIKLLRWFDAEVADRGFRRTQLQLVA